jgi:predicted amidohydrolase YtcJ
MSRLSDRTPKEGGAVNRIEVVSLRTIVVAMVAASVVSSCRNTPRSDQVADLVLRGGNVVTVDSNQSHAEAVAIAGDRILAVGSNAEVSRHIGDSTRVIDLAGRLVLPGFIEGHGHFMGLGRARMILDLTRVSSWDEIVAMVAHVAGDADAGAWILGRGWHQEKWTETPRGSVDGVPTHESLSRVSPNNPVLLTHASGHAAFANAKALELAGITGQTPNPPGGEIVHDTRGEPTGLLRERAQGLVTAAQQRSEAGQSAADAEATAIRAIELAGEDVLSKGITSFHDAGESFATIDLFRKLADAGRLPVRLYVMVRFESNEAMDAHLDDYRMINHANGFLTVRSIKRQIDGALGSHGAWLLEPYDDMPQSTGLVLETVDEVKQAAEIAIRHGYQVNTHAIGDRANREVLNIYEQVMREANAGTDLRWRIEHAQHLHPDDIPRFAKLGVIASMQGVHATSDAPWVLKRLGEKRAKSGAYMWRSLIDAGAVVTNGTDVPVEDADPIACFYASVSRRLDDGTVFFGDQVMTREEALRSYTINNAYAAFEENVKGSVTVGKYADLVVLSADIMTVPEEEIRSARVDYTILAGKVAYQR